MAQLRKGWTTGCCAALAAKAATLALFEGRFPAEVSFVLPNGAEPRFPPVDCRCGPDWAECGIVKDAGDDPDVTHGATIRVRVTRAARGSGMTFVAGEGVGTVTKPGLPLAVGEPAINPSPRRMIEEAVCEATNAAGVSPDLTITVSVPAGDRLAKATLNGRLGIVGGLSILGTTGIVRPFSCAAWIASIHRGIDVAVAGGRTHVIAATGANSERAARERHGLSEDVCLDMGDFVGGTLKYLRGHPIPRLTLAGGIAKFSKLAQGARDLHSKRSRLDFSALEDWLEGEGITAPGVRDANTVLEVQARLGAPFAEAVARAAKREALKMLDGAPVEVEVLVTDRDGGILAVDGFGS